MSCGQEIITIDVDEGTTPAFLACRAVEGCGGIMESSFYSPASVGDAEPQYEWYKPNREERRAGNKDMREYFRRGGLDIRKIE